MRLFCGNAVLAAALRVGLAKGGKQSGGFVIFLYFCKFIRLEKVKQNLDKIIVVGDRVLIEPGTAAKKTQGGLYLPAGYQEKEEIQSGYILKCGPGYALPNVDEAESWNNSQGKVKYLPLQVQPGDLAIFVQKNAVEIKYNGEKYFVVPQSAILLVERDEF